MSSRAITTLPGLLLAALTALLARPATAAHRPCTLPPWRARRARRAIHFAEPTFISFGPGPSGSLCAMP